MNGNMMNVAANGEKRDTNDSLTPIQICCPDMEATTQYWFDHQFPPSSGGGRGGEFRGEHCGEHDERRWCGLDPERQKTA